MTLSPDDEYSIDEINPKMEAEIPKKYRFLPEMSDGASQAQVWRAISGHMMYP